MPKSKKETKETNSCKDKSNNSQWSAEHIEMLFQCIYNKGITCKPKNGFKPQLWLIAAAAVNKAANR